VVVSLCNIESSAVYPSGFFSVFLFSFLYNFLKLKFPWLWYLVSMYLDGGLWISRLPDISFQNYLVQKYDTWIWCSLAVWLWLLFSNILCWGQLSPNNCKKLLIHIRTLFIYLLALLKLWQVISEKKITPCKTFWK